MTKAKMTTVKQLTKKTTRYAARTVIIFALAAIILFDFGNMAEAIAPVPQKKPVAGMEIAEGIPIPPRHPHYSSSQIVESAANAANHMDVPVPSKKPSVVAQEKRRDHYKRAGFLAQADIDLYQKIFAAQKAGDIAKADQYIRKLRDPLLMGHVLFQRYMHPNAYKSSFEELKDWMDQYADHPGADRIYALASARQPADYNGSVRKPQSKTMLKFSGEGVIDRGARYRSPQKRSSAEHKSIRSFKRATQRLAAKGSPSAALDKTKNEVVYKKLDPVEQDRLLADIARAYYFSGDLGKAGKLAAQAAQRSGVNAPMAGWIAGLTQWRQGDYPKAASFFAMTAHSRYSSGWMAAAGAFWTARANMKIGNVKHVSNYLGMAAAHEHTFYGLIATRALGRDFDFNWDLPSFDMDAQRIIATIPQGRRAIALVQAHQSHRAEAELRSIDIGEDFQKQRALMAFANHAGLPSIAMGMATIMVDANGEIYDAALYPLASWRPRGGYKIDHSLIHAIVRQESRFDPRAKSHRGASGLMQIMPATAHYVAGGDSDTLSLIKDPAVNLELGQRYIQSLINDSAVDDLFSLLIAYNGGPGNLRKWQREMADIDDPLLFMESIPLSETRAYVERVSSNFWIYRLRQGLDTPTLDAVAAGRKARFALIDIADRPYQLASIQ